MNVFEKCHKIRGDSIEQSISRKGETDKKKMDSTITKLEVQDVR